MEEEMREGWGTCNHCGNKYFATKVKYPSNDLAHEIPCPSCGATVGMVSKGTDDFNLESEEDIRRQQEYDDKRPNCPICNSKMVMRKGPYSTFWGCSNYPDCTGTRSINSNDDAY
ncbi:hypothetical protein GCM10008908_18680 [Clostridium subterminale]|uniref:DNA topoisomerase type IA zn finger domain-containing protein n=1 Tax=Clostridium subterminale TaxID=1550 RepID=A0ABP3W164_CLOSU